MFSAKTIHSGKLKALFDTLFSNAQTVCLVISKTGVSSETKTTNNALVRFDLPASSFDEYTFTYDQSLYVGLGWHVNQLLKSMKNKTNVTLTIDKPDVLDIEIAPSKTSSSADSSVTDDYLVRYRVTTISAQNVAPILVPQYETNGVYVSNSNFTAICKTFSKSSNMDVSKRNGQLSFSFELAGISTKTLTFGAKHVEDMSLYYGQFKSDLFARVAKLSSFSEGRVRIRAEEGKPLLIEAESTLGKLSVYADFFDEI